LSGSSRLAGIAEAITCLQSINVCAPMATKTPKAAPPIHAALQHFDKLPDSAGARVPVVAALFGVSIPTVWRWSRDQRLPAPIKRGGVTLWNVGALRRAMAATDPDSDTRTASATAAATAKRASVRLV
jgi:predicted DNA-binding transcriptional regulator AlpA